MIQSPSVEAIRRKSKRLAVSTAMVVFLALLFWAALSLAAETPLTPAELQEVVGAVLQRLNARALVIMLVVMMPIALYWNFAIAEASVSLWGKWKGLSAFALLLLTARFFQLAGVAFAVFLLWRLQLAAQRSEAMPSDTHLPPPTGPAP